MRLARLDRTLGFALVALAACGGAGAEPPGATTSGAGGTSATASGTAGAGTGGADAGKPACAIAECAYPALAHWQSPIADYVAAATVEIDPNKLHTAIDDLIVFDDRLYFGYGDATENAGRVVPIEVRYWSSPDDTAPSAEDVVTTEEEVARYRKFGDTLYIPGVDATEDAFLGNVLSKPSGGSFTRHRTVNGGVHVHDVAVFGGALYACGSGTLTLDEWNTGKVHSWIWRSDDGGATFTAAAEVANTVVGDRRWVELMPFADTLYAFGYRTNAQGNIVELLENAWDGTTLTDEPFAPDHFLLGAEMLDESTAVARSVFVTENPLHFDTLVIRPGQPAEVVTALAGKAVLDIHVLSPGKALVLAADGDAYPLPSAPAPIHVLYTEDFAEFKELTTATLPAWPTAIAHWNGALYVGLDNGEVWRSVP